MHGRIFSLMTANLSYALSGGSWARTSSRCAPRPAPASGAHQANLSYRPFARPTGPDSLMEAAPTSCSWAARAVRASTSGARPSGATSETAGRQAWPADCSGCVIARLVPALRIRPAWAWAGAGSAWRMRGREAGAPGLHSARNGFHEPARMRRHRGFSNGCSVFSHSEYAEAFRRAVFSG